MERSMGTDVRVTVLVIYTESDRTFYKHKLKPLVENQGINFCTLEDDGLAGTITENFNSLLKNCDKVLFVLSDAFKHDCTVSYFVEIAARGKSSPADIVSVVLGGSIRFEDAILRLEDSVVVMRESDGWQRELLSALHYTQPKYCHVIGSQLETRGLTLRNMRSDIYGIAVEIDNKCLRIDVKEFQEYLSTHVNVGTCKIFGEYVPLYTEKTAVSLVYRDDLNKMENSSKFVDLLTRLCGDLFNISAARKQKIMTTLGTKLEGPIRDMEFIRRIWLKVFYKAMKKEESDAEMKYPFYNDEAKRVKSFPESWSDSGLPGADQMAAAGLFFKTPPHVATCFMCGYTMFNWRDDDVPWQAHAAINKECTFIHKTRDREEIDEAVESYTAGAFVINNTYADIDARTKTFETFDLSNLTKYRKDFQNPFKDKAELVQKVAEAGFYFAGSDDLFSCYACGLMLSCISEKIFRTHARFSPQCPHVLKTKGNDYVHDVSEDVEDLSKVTFSLRMFTDDHISDRNIVMSTAVRSRKATGDDDQA